MGDDRRRRLAIKKVARKKRKCVGPVYTSKLPIVAVHEAGHVVGRFLTAELMGYDQAFSVAYIDMHNPYSQQPYEGADGRIYSEAAITYGPCFSRMINEAIEASGRNAVTIVDALGIHIAKAAGVDIDAWAKAKLFIALAGPIAEAKDRNISFTEIQRIHECEHDFEDAKATCRKAGWSKETAAAAMIAAADAVYQKFENSGVWRGLLNLAAMLPAEGRVEGNEAWAIYSGALAALPPANQI